MAKILIDARMSGTSTGRYVDKLIEHLHKLKPQHEIIVLAKSTRVEYLREIAPEFKIIRSNYHGFGLSEQIGFLRQLKKLSPDLVHFGMTQQPVLYKGRAVTTIHDLTTLRFDNPARNKLVFSFKRQVYARVVKRVAKKSIYIITPSKYVKQDVAQYAKISPEKIFVTYEAADRISVPAKEVHRLAGKRFIMYVGRALPHKNLMRLVKAFELLRKRHPELMLVMVGKYDDNYHRLSAFVTARRLADSVVFTDYVTEGELKWLYENTAAYVFPSLSEGFGLPPLEAMVHGAPLISSKATCLPEVNGSAAHYFDPRNIKDMAIKINDVLANPKLKTMLLNKGYVQAGKYSWRKMAAETLKIYDQALK